MAIDKTPSTGTAAGSARPVRDFDRQSQQVRAVVARANTVERHRRVEGQHHGRELLRLPIEVANRPR